MDITDNEIKNHYTCMELLQKITEYFNIPNIEKRERLIRFNSRLSIYVNKEENAPHNRPHAHIAVNGKRIGRIWIDTFQINDNIEKRDCKMINEWLQNHKQDLINAWKRNNNRIDIAFNAFL